MIAMNLVIRTEWAQTLAADLSRGHVQQAEAIRVLETDDSPDTALPTCEKG
jgi:hypothetical protein